MSMLYVWDPVRLEDGAVVQVMITRGDSDQVGKGSKQFLEAVLQAIGIKASPKSARIDVFRSNFYSEYWEDGGWESRWDFVWRCRIRVAENVTRLKSPPSAIGIDAIDEYSEKTAQYREGPAKCLVIAAFDSPKAAEKAAGGLTAKRPGKSQPKSEIFKVSAKTTHLHIDLGALDAKSYAAKDALPDRIAKQLEEEGGNLHAAQ